MKILDPYEAESVTMIVERYEHGIRLVLLHGPTGCGKTIILARAANDITANTKTAIFWAMPIIGVRRDTDAAISEQPRLQLRLLKNERQAAQVVSGDTFVTTWQAVAAKNETARRILSDDESNDGLLHFIALLRADGFKIIVVADEAHVYLQPNRQSLRLLRDLAPDLIILATATPAPDLCSMIAEELGLTDEQCATVAIERDQVIAAGRNKPGVTARYFTTTDVAGADHARKAIELGVSAHEAVKAELRLYGISLIPLTLVQVENGDTLDQTKLRLIEAGVPEQAIRIHTATKSDADITSVADDEGVEYLVFKAALALGFNAPRAWGLIALRTTLSTISGLQVVGRLMRVHPLLRDRHDIPAHSILHSAQVILSGGLDHSGLDQAVLDIQEQLSKVSGGTVSFRPAEEDEKPELHTYSLRSDFPQLLAERATTGRVSVDYDRLRLPEGFDLADIVRQTQQVTGYTTEVTINDIATKQDIAAPDIQRNCTRARRWVRQLGLSEAKVMRTLLQLLRDQGLPASMPLDDARMAVYLTILSYPSILAACVERPIMGKELVPVSPPPSIVVRERCLPAAKGTYGIIPPQLYPWETAMIQRMEDEPQVRWWHRNESNRTWSVTVVLSTGKLFFPDFVVGLVDGSVILVEPHLIDKSDSLDVAKVASCHEVYGRPVIVSKAEDRKFHRWEIDEDGVLEMGGVFRFSRRYVLEDQSCELATA